MFHCSVSASNKGSLIPLLLPPYFAAELMRLKIHVPRKSVVRKLRVQNGKDIFYLVQGQFVFVQSAFAPLLQHRALLLIFLDLEHRGSFAP